MPGWPSWSSLKRFRSVTQVFEPSGVSVSTDEASSTDGAVEQAVERDLRQKRRTPRASWSKLSALPSPQTAPASGAEVTALLENGATSVPS